MRVLAVVVLTNFFLQGGELEVLKSIDWTAIKFDVLCVETDPKYRPANYTEEVTSFLETRGYRDAAGQRGRNKCECSSLIL